MIKESILSDFNTLQFESLFYFLRPGIWCLLVTLWMFCPLFWLHTELGGQSCGNLAEWFFPLKFIIMNVIALNMNIESGCSLKKALCYCVFIFIFRDLKLFYIETKPYWHLKKNKKLTGFSQSLRCSLGHLPSFLPSFPPSFPPSLSLFLLPSLLSLSSSSFLPPPSILPSFVQVDDFIHDIDSIYRLF